jgi:hypothetical protein
MNPAHYPHRPMSSVIPHLTTWVCSVLYTRQIVIQNGPWTPRNFRSHPKFRKSGNENLMNSLESLAGWLPHQSSINRHPERFKKAALIG